MRRGLIHRLDPWRRGFALMAVFALLFSNVPPQLTAAAEQYTCGSEKHLHSESCYEKNLACGEEEAAPHYKSTFKVHKHTEKCRDSEGRIVCGYVENEYYHTHNEFCRDAEGNLACGLKEQKPHEHTDACYETDRILICENEDPGHTHTGSCYTEKRVLACEKAEEEGHHHSDGCYAETVIRTCGLEENPGHHHTEECWQDWTELTCGLEENEEHRHGEECYTGHHDLICGQEEQDGHQHSESCFETIWELTCGQEEKEGHHHSDACYTTELELTCGEEERPVHIHSDDCYREERRLVCNKPTSTHRHSDACFNEQGMAICGKVEVPVFESTAENRVGGHTHTEECYEKKLTCELPEHIHSEDCRTESKAEDPENTELETEEMKAGEKQAEEGQNASSEDNITESEKEAEAETAVEAETEEGQDTSSEDGNTEPEEETEAEPAVEAEVEAETETESEVETETEAGTEAETEKKAETETESENTTAETERELPTAITLEAKDAPVQVAVTFSPEAGIPEGTELFVADAADSGLRGAELPSAGPMKKSTGGLKKSALRTRAAEETGLPTADVSLVKWQEGEEAPRIELYHRTLEISLLSDGQTIEPAPGARVSVSVVLPDLEEGLTVEVRHETAEGSILLESSTSGQSVTFTTDSFSVFDFTSSAQKILQKTTESLDIRLFGRSSDQNATLETAKIDENSLPDGFSIIDTTSSPQNENLWMTLQRVKNIALGKLESIDLYAVVDGKIAALVKENVGITDILRLNLGNYSSFALVRDNGLRNKVAELGNVVLSGLMPKNGTAKATDVTDEYAEFVGGRSVDLVGVTDEELGGQGSVKEGEAVEDLGGEGSGKQGETVRTIAAYDISITNDGEEYQPEDKPIEVTIKDEAIQAAIAAGKTLSLWHVLDDGSKERIPDLTISGDTVTFSASGFSVYVLTETIYTYYNTASGETYKITVEYDSTAKLPQNAALAVSEILPGSTDYDNYVAQSIDKLGVKEEALSLSRVFDIKIVDENGAVREPEAPVKVSIQLVGESLTDYASVDVVHFGEDKIDEMSVDIAGDTVEFTTESFSVYVVDGSVRVRTYYFYTYDEYMDYVPYYLNTDIGTEEGQTYIQIVREGQTPVVPQNPVNPQDQEATFAGWYEGSANTADGPTVSTPYAFDSVPSDLNDDEPVYLYAKFSHYIYVIFHDQYDPKSASFPVAFTRRIDLYGEQEMDWGVDLKQYSVSYEDPEEIDDTKMVFVGWSETPVTVPGSSLNDEGETVTKIQTSNGLYEPNDTAHLYPIFQPVQWISFYSGPSGSHATYFTDTYYLNGEGPDSLPGINRMTRDGYLEFSGWYVGASLDSKGETMITGANCVKVANADGSLNIDAGEEEIAKLSAIGITFENTAAEGETASYRLKLTHSVTLYAYWTAKTTANYTIVIVKQNATDEDDEDVSNNTYSFSESFTLSGTINDVLEVSDSRFDNYKALNTYAAYNALHGTELTNENNQTENPYANYKLNTTNSDKSVTVIEGGSGILYLRYDWINRPSITDRFELRFVDPMVTPEHVIKAYTFVQLEGRTYDDRVPYGEVLSSYVPSETPVSTISEDGLSFNGWYADRACTTRAFFDQASYDAFMASTNHGAAVLFSTMPAADITYYAGWTREWFLIKIDPNYGELYKHVYTDNTQTVYVREEDQETHQMVPSFTGTGSTWMWKEYGDTFQEYTTVRRDYVESDSGSWYFVNHNRAYYGYPDDWISGENKERKTYYTKDLGEATEFTTFEYEEGVYRYAGWYEVLADGTEAKDRYDFSKIVDHNITLRLRWMKVGAFYVQYDAGEGTLNHGEENEKLYLELDGDTYSDDADVLITRSAKAPTGYEFTGWTIRGDESGTVYRAGQTFHLLSKYMATVQGNRTVFLDAVYQRVPTATIIYYANGGMVAGTATEETLDYGKYPTGSQFNSRDLVKRANLTASEATATVSHIVNNSEFVLSDATWLYKDSAVFAGWCENRVFDPDDTEHPLLKTDGSEEYRVGANTGETAEDQIVPLYAIWQVDVKYHLNQDTTKADFGGDWTKQPDASGNPVYESINSTTYKQANVLVGSNLGWPPFDPVYKGTEISFRGWATRTGDSEPYTYTTYDFSKPVTGALDLYAVWDNAPTLNVKVVDSTNYPVIAAAPWVDGNSDGTKGDAGISPTSAHQTPAELIAAVTTGADTFNSQNNTTYAFSFATVTSTGMQRIQEERIDQIYYSPKDNKIHLVYGSGTDARYEVLGEDEEICFVYYQVRTPDIGYKLMEISGNVTELTDAMVANSENVSVPKSVKDLNNNNPLSVDSEFVISSSYQPMSWLPASVTNELNQTVNKEKITHYSFAIGAPGATNSVDLHHKTQAYTEDDSRPDIYLKNTWQGISFSLDGTTWFSAGSNPKLYTIFYTETPTIITLYNNTVGLAADMEKEFNYDYWVEEIFLKQYTDTTDPSNPKEYNAGDSRLIFTTRSEDLPQKLSNGETYSPFTTINEIHTYRLTFVLTPEEGFTVTRPTAILDPMTLQPVSGSTQEILLPTINGDQVVNSVSSTLPDWIRDAGDKRDNTYHYSKADVPYTFSYTVQANDGFCGKTAFIPFTNTRETVNVDLHVAKANLDGKIYHASEWRVNDVEKYSVPLPLGETLSLFDGYTYDQFTTDVDENYKPGALIYGHDHHTSASHNQSSGEKDEITLDENASMGCYRLAYEMVNSSNPNVYDIYMKDGGDYRYPLSEMAEQIANDINGVTRPDNGTVFYRLYYLFYPAVTVYYVVENADGTLTPVKGSIDGTNVIDTITYNGEQARLNSNYDGMQADLNTEIVQQGQKVGIWTQSLQISQNVGNDKNGNPIFNIPPLLDNGTNKLDLIYYKLGASTQGSPAAMHDSITDFPGTKNNGYLDENGHVYTSGVTEELFLEIGIQNHRLQWQFKDEPAPQVLDNWPVVYAIYRERGYNLTVSKTVTIATGYNEPYTVTITSTAINRDKYIVDGTGYASIPATPARLDENNELVDGTGVITFEVKDGDSITIQGLIPGVYTVTETGNENDTLTAKTIVNSAETVAEVTDNSEVTVNLDKNIELNLINTPKAICRIGKKLFNTLTSAVEYIENQSTTMTETIEMLTDYLMPASDTPQIPAYLNVTLTTANDYSGSGTATITRKGNVNKPMFYNRGKLTLGNVILNDNDVNGSAMISNEGTIILGGSIDVIDLTHTTAIDSETGLEIPVTTESAGTVSSTSPVLKNAVGGEKGGAIYSKSGTVNVSGGTIEHCSATNGGAIYAEDGDVNIDGGTLQDNSATSGGAIYYAGDDTLTISGGSIGLEDHGNTATNGGAIYMASGTAEITGGTISYNTASASGGGIYTSNADVNVNGSGASIDHNTATVDGGAVHMETLKFMLIAGSITYNSAGNGGAVWTGTGYVEVHGGNMTNNTANGTNTTTTDPDTGETITTSGGCGGAVYAGSSEFIMTGGTLSCNTANGSGGGVYTESGAVTISGSGSTIRDNVAISGNGGGVYTNTGSVTMSVSDGDTGSAKLYGNRAESGNGGALYAGSGNAIVTSVIVGDTTEGNANKAINGSGIFVNTGTLSITDGSIGGNVATKGGAVGIGSADARLTFNNKVKIKDNTMNNSPSNVYLNYDTDAIINFQTLTNDNNTYVGIYVSDDPVTVDEVDTTVLEQRGVPNTRFGVYVNNVTIGKIHNDRTANLAVRQDTTNKKLYWVRDFNVKVYYVADYTNKGLPFSPTDYTTVFTDKGSNGASWKKNLNETPPEYNSAASEVAAHMRVNNDLKLTDTAVFGNAFVKPESGELVDLSFNDYLTDINWNTTDNLWNFIKRDGTPVLGGTNTSTKKTLIFIYTEPYYLSIENNAKDENNNGLTLSISDLTVTVNGKAQSVINSASQTGYGYLYARNDEIQNELKPVQDSDLVLAYGESVRILLPGGKNMAYSMTGAYYSAYDSEHSESNVFADGTVGYRQRETTSTTPTQLYTGSVYASTAFTVNNEYAKTPNTAGRTHELIFGGDRAICRVVADPEITDAQSTEYVEAHAGEENKYEYTFSSLMDAYGFIKAHYIAFSSGDTVTATIEMLMDYMIPESDQVKLTTIENKTIDITFQTAADGYFRYHSDEANAAGTATISRAAGNNGSFIVTPDGGTYVDTLKVKNLIFDGKSFGGDNIEGGIIKTKGWNVEIDDCNFNNCRAKIGGGIFVESVPPKSNNTPYGHLTVSNSYFTNCQSLYGEDKYGGGALWTSMRTMNLTGCTFDSCRAEAKIGPQNAQGGAAFHYVGNINVDIDTRSTITSCTFENCSANAGGSMECGAKTVRLTGCTFRNSTARTKNSGAFNVWVYNSDKSPNPSYVYVDNCTFENCYCITVSDTTGNGGAFRSTATYNTVTNCTFTNTTGAKGGAINITNSNAVDTFVSGCNFNGCTAVQQGGAIYCMSKMLTIDSISHETNAATANITSIRNCTAANEGGGVYHANSGTGSKLTVSNTIIDTCSSTTKMGGGIYTTALTAEFSDSIIQNCSTVAADQKGGGMYLGKSTNTTLSGTTIRNCTATGQGGGVYHADKGTFTVSNGSIISGNIAKSSETVTSDNAGATYEMSGGGIYTKAISFLLENSSVTDNQGAGSGGGICQNYDNTNGKMTVNGATVTGNRCGEFGGGLFTLTNMELKGITTITDNRLTTGANTANNAAGVYLRNGVSLSLGAEGGTATDHVFTITDNLTMDGTRSDLRLPEKTANGEIVNDTKVKVYCDINGEIRVVNANKKLTQFGTAQGSLANPAGFTDEHKVFWSEDHSSLYGIVNRQDTNGKEIIWGGAPICKITDGNGRPLYIKVDETHYRPAVFDLLDIGDPNNKTTVSAFSTLRRDENLYSLSGANQYTEYTGNDYRVQMLVEKYEASNCITATGGTGRNVTLTTAKTTDSWYPYIGSEGTRCSILRANKNTDKALLTAKTNLILTNILLDGGSEDGVTVKANTRVITADGGQNTPIQITLGRNATLQNATCTGNGGAVYLDYGAKLDISGGTIRNCTANNGGGVYIDGQAGTFTMSVGTITRCTATGDGGGVYFNKGKLDDASNPTSGFMRINGGSISLCTAKNGGGVYLKGSNDQRTLYMSGGSIASNSAEVKGGGIFVGNEKVRIYFSGTPYVYGNTSDGSVASNKACNVEMDQTFTRSSSKPDTVIVSAGLNRGARIGVYVPGEDSGKPRGIDGAAETDTLYDKHGAELDPFATFTDSSARGLNYFLNDRNGMKGGRLENQAGDDMKVYWRIIYALTVKKQVLSDEANDQTRYRFTLELKDEKNPSNVINDRYGDLNFTDGKTIFTLQNGEEKTAELLPLGLTYTIKEVLTQDQEKIFHTSVEDWDGTVTSGTVITGVMEKSEHFEYVVTFSNLQAICKVTDQNGRLLYTYNSQRNEYVPAVYSLLVTAFNKVNAGNGNNWFYLGDDGNYSECSPNSYQIQMLVPEYETEAAATLQNGRSALLTTAERYATDGFPYVGGDTVAKISRLFDGGSMISVSSGSLTLGNITLDGDSGNHSSTVNGGIINVSSGSSLTVGTGTTLQNSVTSEKGAAVYLAEDAFMYISGGPVFANNVTTGALLGTDPKNGNDSKYYSGNTAKQDIYIDGYSGTESKSLVVTGDITSAEGSINVWAAENPHYIQNQQFAVLDGGDWTGLEAFRNARTDEQTHNPLQGMPRYLYGISRDGKVFWSGSMNLEISKAVDDQYINNLDEQEFDFTVNVPELADGYICDFARYQKTEGNGWNLISNPLTNDPDTLTVTNGTLTFTLKHNEKIVLSVPRGLTVTVAETGSIVDYYDVSYKIDGAASVNGNVKRNLVVEKDTDIAFTNVRKMQTVTVSKRLIDASATGAVDFNFAVLMKLNDEPYADYTLNGDKSIVTDSTGQATFTLSPSPSQITDSIAFTVPYGTYLEVEEDTEAVIGGSSEKVSQIYDTTVRANSGPEVTADSYTFDSVAGNERLTFTNMRKAKDLTITKSVTGGMGDLTKEFSFTIEGLPDSESYTWTKYSADGTSMGTDTIKNGRGSFELAHLQRIIIHNIPQNTELTITETNRGLYTTTWAGNDNNVVSVTQDAEDPAKAKIKVIGESNAIVTVTNDLPAVSPTGFSTRHTPFLFLLLIGILLLMGNGVAVKKRNRISDQEPDVHQNTGSPPPLWKRKHRKGDPITTDAESHIRWRNSVWVKHTDGGGGAG